MLVNSYRAPEYTKTSPPIQVHASYLVLLECPHDHVCVDAGSKGGSKAGFTLKQWVFFQCKSCLPSLQHHDAQPGSSGCLFILWHGKSAFLQLFTQSVCMEH